MVSDLTVTIARAARDKGGRALVVGGAVRDRLLGGESKDVDLEVFGLEAAELRAMLERIGRVDTVGESFTVYKVGNVDVALPRRESKVGRGHRGFEVSGDPSLSLEEASRRRDFTINAIAWDPLSGEYFDPHGGRADLERRVLRAVHPPTFGEDSLRVLRALQFAARFELSTDEATRHLLGTIALDDLPTERIRGEIEKLLLLPTRPSIGFQLGLEVGAVEKLFPELAALVGCPQEPEWHPEGDVWTHTLMVVDRARSVIDDLERPRALAIMLGAVCHDFGKPATTAFLDGRIRSLDHEDAGVAPALRFLDRLSVHTVDGYDVRRQVIGFVAHHLKPGMFSKVRHEISDGAFRRLAQKVDLALLARLAKADCLGRTGEFDCSAMDWFLERAVALGVEHTAPKPFLLGRHLLELGLEPGPLIGEILRQVYEQQLDGRIADTTEAIAAAKELIRN
jgi:tRNA nucleotidyltransferase (CCA-adding enzyme)